MERTLERSERHSEGVMQFQWALIEAMKDSHKTQTRRVKRRNERLFWARGRWYLGRQASSRKNVRAYWDIPTVVILEDAGQVKRIRWQVGRRYAINPPPGPEDKGRMGKAVGSYECMGLREERLMSITDADARREGCAYAPYGWVHAFVHLWDSIAKRGERFADNPTVFVIEMGEFEWEEE